MPQIGAICRADKATGTILSIEHENLVSGENGNEE